MTLDDLDRQAAEACLRAAITALQEGRTEDALHLIGDAAEATGTLLVYRLSSDAAKARG